MPRLERADARLLQTGSTVTLNGKSIGIKHLNADVFAKVLRQRSASKSQETSSLEQKKARLAELEKQFGIV